MLREWSKDLVGLFFPNLCLLCKQDLVSEEKHICTSCLVDLPQTNFHHHKENTLSQKLKGRFDFEYATALYYFNTASKIQEILHEIKYNDNQHLAYYLGELMAAKLKDHFNTIDIVIPIPLHAKRKKERGYNQSEEMAKGFGRTLGIPIDTTTVRRIKNTETQTHKTRGERIENMQNAFHWSSPLLGKNILLIDDVITTGSTIESLLLARPQSDGGSISILSLAAAIES